MDKDGRVNSQLKRLVVGLLDSVVAESGDADIEAVALLVSCAPASVIREKLFEHLLEHRELIAARDESLFDRVTESVANEDAMIKDTVRGLLGNWDRLSPALKKKVWGTLNTGNRIISK